jgi:hypothetical protein
VSRGVSGGTKRGTIRCRLGWSRVASGWRSCPGNTGAAASRCHTHAHSGYLRSQRSQVRILPGAPPLFATWLRRASLQPRRSAPRARDRGSPRCPWKSADEGAYGGFMAHQLSAGLDTERADVRPVGVPHRHVEAERGVAPLELRPDAHDLVPPAGGAPRTPAAHDSLSPSACTNRRAATTAAQTGFTCASSRRLLRPRPPPGPATRHLRTEASLTWPSP